ncbi:MAG TPA: response regulator [Tepidisphaeraceae bacterium]|jgi:two-component system cell cycle response regulator
MILVVDDNVETCNLLMRVLKIAHNEGYCVGGGYAAMSWLENNRPDLVILDVNMPDISGLEILKRIKSNPELRSIPVVMHTALPAAEIVKEANDCGADGVLLKGRYQLGDVIEVVKTFTPPCRDN